MSKKKRYEIETIEQLCNIVNSENFERLSIDFMLWLNHINKSFENIKQKNPEFKDKLNSQIAKVKFIWNDDGIEGLKNIQLKNNETGEIKNIKPKKK